jgi:hypothetical protein
MKKRIIKWSKNYINELHTVFLEMFMLIQDEGSYVCSQIADSGLTQRCTEVKQEFIRAQTPIDFLAFTNM